METGYALAQFTLSLVNVPDESVIVNWHTKDGTAKAGVDYVANAGSVTFLPGETALDIFVEILPRVAETEDRIFYITLIPPVNAQLVDPEAQCTIHVDTTAPVPTVELIVATGPHGDKGDKGDTGAAGAKGDTGSVGAKGDKGDKGDTGDEGRQGPPGVQGPIGATGPKGDKGDKGDIGPQGPSGAASGSVTGVRLGAQGTTKVNSFPTLVPGGCVMTGWGYEGENPGGDTVYYKPIQQCINGTWSNVTG